MATAPASEAGRNAILAALTHGDLALLVPHLDRVEIAQGQLVYPPGAAIDRLYFPLSGLVSLVSVLRSGRSIEVGTVSREGLVGVPFGDGALNLAYEVRGQIPAACLAIGAADLARALEASEGIRRGLYRATASLTATMAQTAACNASHDVLPRLAKWLLHSADAGDSSVIDLTHEFLALMVGAQRPTVTLAAGRLQDDGAIEYRRGRVRVLDRSALLAASCECYATVVSTREALGAH